MSKTIVDRTSGITKTVTRSVIGQKEPLAHPKNCSHECPYGYGRAFCWPCMAKIMNEHRANRKVQEA
ncbi:MAG: hypothetical protein J6M44_03160 [Butyrivibrio sp.]|uniref:hypothetical protein n=1 Tax=Butyrivibrio sp. TaxID=28121 RepID=UPI001B2132FF|nr:hypothetical protein [Butyrivibrio sp.]MBO6241424.1 hypothetical protein [Butyrivibrio sp.]MBP3277936.1 hypothetical protein [Butyrivibrio sp.]